MMLRAVRSLRPRRLRSLLPLPLQFTVGRRTPPSPSPRPAATAAAPNMKWTTPPMPSEGVDASFGRVWAAALDADVRGQYASALSEARAAIEVAARSDAGPGREQASRLAHHLAGVSLLRMGRVAEAAKALDKARAIAVAASSGGYGDDAYTDVGGVLIDSGVALAMQGDVDGAQKHLSRALYMGERAYRQDDDLVSAACSNLAEVLALREREYEHALELAERAVRLTDKMERFSMIRQQEKEEGGAGKKGQQRVGGGDGGGGGGGAAGVVEGKGAEGRQPRRSSEAIWAVPAELLALNARGITRRLNLGRLLVRGVGRGKEEGLFYIFQALQDSRKAGLRGNAVLYCQCLAAAGAAHVASLLAEVRVGICLCGCGCVGVCLSVGGWVWMDFGHED
jgi:tetratricopeptide (TPR) repeat protein